MRKLRNKNVNKNSRRARQNKTTMNASLTIWNRTGSQYPCMLASRISCSYLVFHISSSFALLCRPPDHSAASLIFTFHFINKIIFISFAFAAHCAMHELAAAFARFACNVRCTLTSPQPANRKENTYVWLCNSAIIVSRLLSDGGGGGGGGGADGDGGVETAGSR